MMQSFPDVFVVSALSTLRRQGSVHHGLTAGYRQSKDRVATGFQTVGVGR
jgi:hypothetical protein